MTDEELAAIREQTDQWQDPMSLAINVFKLIGEVDRLRAIEIGLQQELTTTAETLSAAYDELVEKTRHAAAMRPIVEAVADDDGERVAKRLWDIHEQARALLAKEGDDASLA